MTKQLMSAERVKLTKARRAWLRRADTLHRRAGALLSDMISELGLDHEATNYADSVVERAEELASILSKPGLELWKTPAPAGDR